MNNVVLEGVEKVEDTWAFDKFVDSKLVKEYSTMVKDNHIESVLVTALQTKTSNFGDLKTMSLTNSVIASQHNYGQPVPSLLFNDYKLSVVDKCNESQPFRDENSIIKYFADTKSSEVFKQNLKQNK